MNQYGPTLAPLSPASCCEAPPLTPNAGELEHFSLGALTTNPVGDLLVLYQGQGGPIGPPNLIKLFGPGPVQFEAPPAVPPTITSQFASSVQSTEATVSGFVNSHFWTNTKVYVEYGTGSCAAGECTATKPVPPGEILTAKASGSLSKVPGIILEGLEPNSLYHYRLVAVSGGGGPVVGIGGTESSAGEESSFTTATPQSEPQGGCPNADVKTGFSSPLPDCRAYEMVSPVDKDGGDIKTLVNAFSFSNAVDQSAAGGSAFTFSSYRAFGQADGAAMTNQYLSTREEGVGWKTSTITPTQALNSSGGSGYQVGVNWDNMFRAFSPDLCSAWAFVATEPALDDAVADAELPVLYRRENCAAPGGYEALAQPEAVEPKSGGPEVELQGISADGSAIVVRSNNNLISDAGGGGKARAYYVGGDQTALVCILPDGSRYEGDCAAGSTPAISGLVGEGEANRIGSVTHAMSVDGSRIYWTAIADKFKGSGTVYLRQNPGAEQSASGGCDEAERACTIKVSGTKSSAGALFRAASADGSTALYEFVEGNLAGNLYEFEADTGTSSLVAKKSLGYVAGSEDLSVFYFVSEEKLADTTGATKGQPNLYSMQEGSPTFIATLSRLDASTDPRHLSNVSPQAVFNIARATPDGRTLAFLSTNSLTGYDNTDAASPLPCGVSEGSKEGICDAEVYLYRVGSESPVCVSCNPTGAQPEGRRDLRVGGTKQIPYTIAGNLTVRTTQLYTPRNLSPDGRRLFFDSYSSLLPRDTNGKQDVYEWEAAAGAAECQAMGAERYVASSQGCLSLISSGESSADSEFLDADESGRNAFFVTNASLLPQDPGLYDVYDARVEGGFPQPEVVAACEGEACQGPFSPPTDPTPASSSFNGPGNFQPKSTAKKKHKKHKKKQKQRKKQKAGRDNKKANRDGRNG